MIDETWYKGAMRDAQQRAERVWPPERRDPTPAGLQRAQEFLTKLEEDEGLSFSDDEDLEVLADRPEARSLYGRVVCWARIMNVLARFPRDFFDIFASNRRSIVISIGPGNDFSGHDSESRPIGAPGSRHYGVSLRQRGIEVPDDVFAGVLVHELCHAVLDHPDSLTWPQAPQERRRFVQELEDEAICLACEVGFVQETKAYVRCGFGPDWDEREVQRVLAIIAEYEQQSTA